MHKICMSKVRPRSPTTLTCCSQPVPSALACLRAPPSRSCSSLRPWLVVINERSGQATSGKNVAINITIMWHDEAAEGGQREVRGRPEGAQGKAEGRLSRAQQIVKLLSGNIVARCRTDLSCLHIKKCSPPFPAGQSPALIVHSNFIFKACAANYVGCLYASYAGPPWGV